MDNPIWSRRGLVVAVLLLLGLLVVGGLWYGPARSRDAKANSASNNDCGDADPVTATAAQPVQATPSCSYCTFTSPVDCTICVRDNPRFEVGADGLATQVLRVCNAGDSPVPLALSVGDFSAIGLEVNPLPLNTTRKISGETSGDKPVVEAGATLGQNKCVNARVDLGRLWQAGPMTATLFNGKKELVKLVALRQRVPFALKIDGPNPEALDLSFRRGCSTVIRLRNDDSMTYRFRWRLELGEHVLKDGATVAPTGSSELRVKLESSAYGVLDSAFLRPAKLQGRLVLRHEPDPGFQDLPGDSRTFPVTATLRAFEPTYQTIVNVGWTLMVLMLGVVTSLVINFALPMQKRRVALKKALDQTEAQLGGRVEVIGPHTLTVLRVERRRLRANVGDLNPFFPDAEDAMPLLEARVKTFCKRVDLAVLASGCLVALKDIKTLGLHEVEQITANCNVAVKVAEQSAPTDADLQRAMAALNLASTQVDAEDEPPTQAAVDALKLREASTSVSLGEIPVTLLVPLGSPDNKATWDRLNDLRASLEASVTLPNAGDTAMTRAQFVRASEALWKAEKVVRFAALVRNAENPTVAAQRMARAGELIDALSPGPDASVISVRALMHQIEQNVSDAALLDALKEANAPTVWIEVDPRSPSEYQIVALRLRISKAGFDEADARRSIRCCWKVNDNSVDGDDWSVFTFFDLPGTFKNRSSPTVFKITAELSGPAGVLLVKPQAVTVTLPQRIFFRSSTALSLGSLAITVVIVTIGLLTAAQEKLQTLDWASGTVALLVLGFGADVIKRALSKP